MERVKKRFGWLRAWFRKIREYIVYFLMTMIITPALIFYGVEYYKYQTITLEENMMSITFTVFASIFMVMVFLLIYIKENKKAIEENTKLIQENKEMLKTILEMSRATQELTEYMSEKQIDDKREVIEAIKCNAELIMQKHLDSEFGE